jgi:hypothetical protein
MILTIAFTQFVFASLGMLALRVLLKAGGYAANVEDMFPRFPVWLSHNGFLLFLVPLLWSAFASLCVHKGSGLLGESTARVTGVAGIVGIFAVCFYAAWLLI